MDLHISKVGNNMRLITDIKLDYKDVLFCPKRSTLKSRGDVVLEREFTFPHSKSKWKGIPIVASNMDSIGTFEMADSLNKFEMLTCLHKHYELQEYVAYSTYDEFFKNSIISIGTAYEDSAKMVYTFDMFPCLQFLCIDVANGYTQGFSSFVSKIREDNRDLIIIAGNVVTSEMTEELILAGADIVKVGIGTGSVCTTRVKTGVGYPQLSAVIECADAAHGIGGHIMADGGCINSGDIAKAFGAGADFVMLGGMLAGHDECGGEIKHRDGTNIKEFYGMSSHVAMAKYGSALDYRASEGKLVEVPCQGKVENTIKEILGGIRSTCTYIGAESIKDIPKCTTFVKVTQISNEVFGKNW